MKKIIKYFSLILFGSFFMFLLASNPVDAIYDRELNNTWVSVSKSEIKITVQYQRGFEKNYATYRWCYVNSVDGACGSYVSVNGSNDPYVVNYVTNGGDGSLSYIALGDASHADNNLTTYTFTVPAYDTDNINGDQVLGNLGDYANKKLALVVDVYYCAVRAEVDGTYVACSYSDNSHPDKKIQVDVDVNDLINNKDYMNKEIEDENIEGLMSQITNIVHGTVMPIIWAVLGLFLVVKGTLIGVQIVKAADEPQVRQEKVGSLKWLVIGVAIAYGASFLVSAVVGFFEGAFK